MSVIQVEDLVAYQLRTSYLNEVADGVGERLITLNEAFLNSAPFRAAGWRPNPAHIQRTHSPPIPTAIASEYFQAPRLAGLTLEDDGYEGGVLTGGGVGTVGPGIVTKRRRRREPMEEDDSSDLSDESDDDTDQRAAQQIKFAKMPLRNRSGSSPVQSSNLKRSSVVASPRAPGPRRGSQSQLETVKERARRDTVTSSEVSSENEFDASGFHRQREAARAAAKGARLQATLGTEPTVGIRRQESDLLEEQGKEGGEEDEEDEEEEEEEEEEDSDGSDMSSNFVGSIDLASILDRVDEPMPGEPGQPLVGTPPREFTRTSTIRRSHAPPPTQVMGELPPPRPMSTIRPMSVVQPKSLLSAALKAKKSKGTIPFGSFGSFSGQGDPNPIMCRIYAPFSDSPSKPFEVLIRRAVHESEITSRAVAVADLIGLSLLRYNQENREPPLPSEKLNVNWWTLRMVEEGGEVDDDFPPLERKKPLTSFTTANNRAGGRGRANSKVYDEFALVQASQAEFADNQTMTPQFADETVDEGGGDDEDLTPRNTPAPKASLLAPPTQPRLNPVITTTYRHATLLADTPHVAASVSNTARGHKKLLRIHILSSDVTAGQMVTLDVTTDNYLEEVLDLVCRKRQLDKANHVLRLPSSGVVVLLDRTVSSIGNVTDLELHRRRFATDGPLTMSGSPKSASPKPALYGSDAAARTRAAGRRMMNSHPLAKEAIKQEELGSANYKRYTVWRKHQMGFGGRDQRLLVIDGEYVHIMPASGGKAMLEGGGKTTTVHFSNVVGCKVTRRHPTNFKLVVYKDTETKRYDFETKSVDQAAEIVFELKKGIAPYQEVNEWGT